MRGGKGGRAVSEGFERREGVECGKWTCCESSKWTARVVEGAVEDEDEDEAVDVEVEVVVVVLEEEEEVEVEG